MKNKFYAVAIMLMAFYANSFAQSIAFASTTAVLVTPISIAKVVDMHFGTLAASSTAGTATLDYGNVVTPSGGVSIPAGGVTPTTAEFTVIGEGTSSFDITVPTSITLTGSVSGTMTVDGFVCDGGAATDLASGSATLKVGAVLHVAADQVAGTYSNNTGLVATSLFVTVNYN